MLAAGILQLLFQLPSLKGINLLTLPRWGWSHPGVRKVMTLMVPTLFGSSVAQINLLLDTVIAAKLTDGSQSRLSLADRFLELPLGVFGVALGTVILPALARHHVSTDREGFALVGLGPAHDPADLGAGHAGPAAAGRAADRDHLPARPVQCLRYPHDRVVGVRPELRPAGIRPAEGGTAGFLRPPDTKTPVRAGVAALVANMVFNFALLAVLYQVMVPDELKAQGVMAAIGKQPGLHWRWALPVRCPVT